MTRALWRAPSIAAGHLGRGPIARTLVVAAEAGAPHRSVGEGAAVAWHDVALSGCGGSGAALMVCAKMSA